MTKLKRVIPLVLCLITLIALFTACKCTKKVTYVVEGTEKVEEVKCGDMAKMPENPTKEGYVFSGWYTDAKYTMKYDFDSKVKSDIKLYAKFVEDVQQPSAEQDSKGAEAKQTPNAKAQNQNGYTPKRREI